MNTLNAPTDTAQDRVGHNAQEHLRADTHQAHPPGDACMFCDETVGLARTSEDPLAFRDHLARHDHCHREYQMWKQVITDEWLGD